MDDLDLRILRSLYGATSRGRRGIPTAWDVASVVGAHGTTVKRRLSALRAAGVLGAVRLAPSPRLLGAEVGFFLFSFPSAAAKTDGIARLSESPEITEVHDFVGEACAAWVYTREGEALGPAVERHRRAAGARAATLLQRYLPQGSPSGASPLDRRLLAALAPEAHEPLARVARALRVTPKTVRLRLAALDRARAFTVYPSISLAHVEGLVGHVLLADLHPGRAPRAQVDFRRAFPNHVCMGSGTGSCAWAFLVARTTGEVAAEIERALAIDGVRDARVRLVSGLRAMPEKLQARLLDGEAREKGTRGRCAAPRPVVSSTP